MTKTLISFILGALALGSMQAASITGPAIPGVYRQTDLDGGGWLTGFASHSSGALYARTDVGGVYRSDDRGDTWRFISGSLTSPAAHSPQGIAVGETSADLIYQACGISYLGEDVGRGVWKSADAGTTWTQVVSGVNFSGNDELRWQGECLAITPGSGDQEIWAISRAGGLWRSTVGGNGGTWNQEGGVLFEALVGHVVHMHPSFPNEIYIGGLKAAGTSALYRGTRGAGGGVAYTAITVDAGATSVSRLARLPSGVMFAAVEVGTEQRFYRSDTTGTMWSDITTSVRGGAFVNSPVGMCHVLRDASTIILGWIGGPTRRSTDGGNSWSTVPLTITGSRPPAMLTSEVAPGWARGSVHQDPIDPNRWYLPNGFGPYRTTDAGATVQYMTTGIGEVVCWKPSFHPTDPLRVYLPTADLIGFIATDGSLTGLPGRNGRRSLPVTFGNVGMSYSTRALVGPVVGNAPPRVYFVGGSFFGPNAGRAGILTTPDDGLTWALVHVSGITGSGLPGICSIVNGSVAPDNANELLITVATVDPATSGIYRSTDGGVNFTKSTGIPGGANWGTEFSHFSLMENDPSNPARRYTWVAGVGFLRSLDRGITWASVGNSANGPAEGRLYNWNSWGVFARDADTGRLWFGGFNDHLGLAYSDDFGDSWTYLDPPFSNTGFEDVRALDAFDGQVIVFAKRFGDPYFKIYYSRDNGVVWQECTKAGYRLPTTTYVALDPHRAGHFWAASSGRSYTRFTPGELGQWQQENFSSLQLNTPSVSDADADPDGDGLSNKMEWAFNLPPFSAAGSSAALPHFASLSEIRFRRNPGASSLNYLLQSSGDLAFWDTLVTYTGASSLPASFGPGINLIDDAATQSLRFRPAQTAARRYYRINIDPAP